MICTVAVNGNIVCYSRVYIFLFWVIAKTKLKPKSIKGNLNSFYVVKTKCALLCCIRTRTRTQKKHVEIKVICFSVSLIIRFALWIASKNYDISMMMQTMKTMKHVIMQWTMQQYPTISIRFVFVSLFSIVFPWCINLMDFSEWKITLRLVFMLPFGASVVCLNLDVRACNLLARLWFGEKFMDQF